LTSGENIAELRKSFDKEIIMEVLHSQHDRTKAEQRLFTFPEHPASGSEVIARSIEELAGENAIVMGVPGSPTTDIVEWLEENGRLSRYWVEMSEVDMMRQLIGANKHGRPTVGVMKHTGFFRIQELVAIMANHDLIAPMILVVGDEPGASSQNGNDSRFLCDSSYIPIVEPSFNNIPECFSYCMRISAELRKPVVFRIVPSVADHIGTVEDTSRILELLSIAHEPSHRDYYASEGMVVGRYARSKAMLRALDLANHEGSAINPLHETGSKKLVITAGGITDRVRKTIQENYDHLSHLEMNTVTNLPEATLARTLKHYESILVLESWEPYMERRLRDLIQRIKTTRKVSLHGREPKIEPDSLDSDPMSGTGAGDLSDSEIQNIIDAFLGGHDFASTYTDKYIDHQFSQEVDARYLSVFENFVSVSEETGRTPVFSVSTGRTRYSVMHSKYEHYVKFMSPMGSEAMTLVGYLRYSEARSSLAPCLIIGDYTFAHSTWSGICALNLYRAREGLKVPTMLIDNGGSHTTGGQSCSTPEEFGSQVVTNWHQRFLGTVSIYDTESLRKYMAQLIDPDVAEDIIIISVPDTNKGT